MWPRSRSKPSTRFSGVVSTWIASVPNCCPPIACRPPATLTLRPSALARRTAARSTSMESALTTRSTRVALSCDWTSLTSAPGGAARGRPQPERPVSPVAPRRNSRRVNTWWSPDRAGGDGPARRPEHAQQRDRLDRMIERVVVEVDGMERHALELDEGADEHQGQSHRAPQGAGRSGALPLHQEDHEQEHHGGEIV